MNLIWFLDWSPVKKIEEGGTIRNAGGHVGLWRENASVVIVNKQLPNIIEGKQSSFAAALKCQMTGKVKFIKAKCSATMMNT